MGTRWSILQALHPSPRTTRHRPHSWHAGRQDRAEPEDEPDAGGDCAGDLQILVREEFAERAARRARLAHGKSSLPENIRRIFPDEFQDSELGPIPKGWEVGQLGDLVGFLSGYAFRSRDWRDKGIPVVKIGSIKPGIIDLDTVSYVSEQVATQASRYRLSPADLLVGMTGYVGEVGLVPPTDNLPLLNQRVGKFVPEKNGTESLGFVYCLTRRPQFKAEVEAKSHGTAQANVSAKGILSIVVILPPRPLRELFNRICKPVFDRILNDWAKSHILTALRDTLLPRLISGELWVRDVERFLKEREGYEPEDRHYQAHNNAQRESAH